MENYNLAVLIDAKTEYTNQLINLCKGRMYSCIQQLFKSSKQECKENDKQTDTLSMFQTKLAQIPKWDNDKLQTEYDQLIISSNCDWLNELLTAVFMSHSRILSSVHSKPSNPQVSLDIPSFQEFMHQCYIDIARCFWKSPYLFDDTVSSYEYQRNRRDCELMIEKTIGESLRKQLPVKHLLKNYLGDDIKKMKQAVVENDINQEEQENLRNMVQKEIKKNTPSVEEQIKEETESKETDSCKENNKTDKVDGKNKENVIVNISEETELSDKKNEEELNTIDLQENNNLETINLSQEIDLPFDIELEDLTSSLQDQGVVYDLLPEDMNTDMKTDMETDIKKQVKDELQNLIENQDNNIKKVTVTEEPCETDVKVTKINNPEYNFFTDAATTL